MLYVLGGGGVGKEGWRGVGKGGWRGVGEGLERGGRGGVGEARHSTLQKPRLKNPTDVPKMKVTYIATPSRNWEVLGEILGLPISQFFVADLAGPGRIFLQQAFYCAKRSAEPSCRIPKVLQNAGEPLGAPARLFMTLLPKCSLFFWFSPMLFLSGSSCQVADIFCCFPCSDPCSDKKIPFKL